LANAHAGPESGCYFIPELDEEVMVGFESGDAEKPYVLGSLYNGKRMPAGSWGSSGNDFKAIRTRSGNTIELIDKNGKEEIIIYQQNDKAAAHHISLLSGSDPVLNIFSKGKLVLQAKSIEIKSSGSIDVQANQNVSLKGDSNVSIKSGSQMDVEAGSDLNMEARENVRSNAGVEHSSKGTLLNIEGGAKATIKGGIVMIN